MALFKKYIEKGVETAPAAADNREAVKAEKAARAAKKKVTARERAARISKWWRELRSEFKKIVWPTRQQLIKKTCVVLVIMLALGLCIALLDFIFEQLILESILKLVTGY